ncbi:AEC family transporter [Pseudohalocynthiibacter sp. F2068]|uniref:AEC family transporter n=1 Tax=Pseudohalocynthiibacter sp. F2068 TaxID=2926418 RepID=UPI001FF21353|nr:AEC family transporter [Pseudohalocynthiibacter sp. F2068]MCK0104440.1 AEC family transporter [Pseudohalocynthiibacter sp. F2068]
MSLALTVIEITAPVFLLAAIGFVWVRLGFEYRVEFVTRLAMTLAVPALIFIALMETKIPAQSLSLISLAAIVGYVVATLAAWVLVRITGLDLRTYLAPIVMGNTGNIGLPLAFFAYGDEGLGYAVVVFAISAIYSFTFGVWIVSRARSPLAMFKEPIVAATLLGALFLWQGWETPSVVTNTLSLVGQMAIPLMLVTLGVAVARLTPRNLGRAAWVSVAKTALCAGIAWSVGLWFGLPHVAFGILVLQMAAPAAVTSYLLAEKYGADAQAVAGLVVVSTLLAIVTLPILLGAVL